MAKTIRTPRPIGPIEPMLAKKLSDKKLGRIFKNQKDSVAEVKYDGFRIQIHTDDEIQLYTRNMNPIDPRHFPELIKPLSKMPQGIWDGEIYGKGSRKEGFQTIQKRFRADNSAELAEAYPLQIRLFDCMCIENYMIMDSSFKERSRVLEKISLPEGIMKAEQFQVADESQLQSVYDEVIGKGLEGLVVKDTTGLYIPGGRGYEWVKLKEFETYDLVIMGLYKGEGKLGELPFAGVVVGTKNAEGKYETITKVGLTSEDKVREIYSKVKDKIIGYAPENSVFSEELKKKSWKRKVPFAYINPEDSIVLEVEAQDVTRSKNWHTCGIEDGLAFSLRIPSVVGLRYDKSSSDCTTTEQVKEIYGGA